MESMTKKTAESSNNLFAVDKFLKRTTTDSSAIVNSPTSGGLKTGLSKLLSGMPKTDYPKVSDSEARKKEITAILAAFERRLSDSNKFSREDLKTLLQSKFGLKLTEQQAVEGIVFCRGRHMEKSSFFERSKLVDWLVLQIPILKA